MLVRASSGSGGGGGSYNYGTYGPNSSSTARYKMYFKPIGDEWTFSYYGNSVTAIYHHTSSMGSNVEESYNGTVQTIALSTAFSTSGDRYYKDLNGLMRTIVSGEVSNVEGINN